MKLLLLALLPAVLLAGCTDNGTGDVTPGPAATSTTPSDPADGGAPPSETTNPPGTTDGAATTDDSPGPAPAPAPATNPAASTKLVLTVQYDLGSVPDVWELTCDPTGGTHPDPAAACAFLDDQAAAGSDPFAPTPDDVVCTQQYLGPATATIAGVWNNVSVIGTYNLTDGCEIDRWNTAQPLLVHSTDGLAETAPPV